MTSHRDSEEPPAGHGQARRTALGVLAAATAVTAAVVFLALSTLGGQDGVRTALALEVEVVEETTARLRWSPYTEAEFAAYLVLRADAPHQARYPLDDHTTVVTRITDPKSIQYSDAMREPAGRSYRVVAVDDGSRLLARSPAVSSPAAGDINGGETPPRKSSTARLKSGAASTIRP